MIPLFDEKRPKPSPNELPELIGLALYCNTPEAGTVEYALARALLAALTDPALREASVEVLIEYAAGLR